MKPGCLARRFADRVTVRGSRVTEPGTRFERLVYEVEGVWAGVVSRVEVFSDQLTHRTDCPCRKGTAGYDLYKKIGTPSGSGS